MRYYISFCLLPVFLNYIFRKFFCKPLTYRPLPHPHDKYYCRGLFFYANNENCKHHVSVKHYCGFHCSYYKLQLFVEFIQRAKESICLCMYLISLKTVYTELVEAKNRGVKIRVISDNIMASLNCSQVAKLMSNGVDCVTNYDRGNLMHHKFCIIDENNEKNARMWFGSLNLTMQGIVSNYECVVFTNNPHTIKAFTTEFNTLWTDFDYLFFDDE